VLKKLRKIRAFMWSAQIVLGDIIAIMTGRYISRLAYKAVAKRAGRKLKKVTG